MKKTLITAGLVAAYALLCWAVETWHDSRPARPVHGLAWLALIGAGVGVLVLALAIHFTRFQR